MKATSSRPIVIGVDDSRSAANAVRWGLTLAERQLAPVRLVRAYDRSMADTWIRDRHERGTGSELVDAARDQLEAMRLLAAEAHPKIEISAHFVGGSAAAALIGESQDAEAVIIGAHGATAFSTLVAGATTMNVATQARCTVVTVPSDEGRAFDGMGIVVGVDGSKLSDDAIGYAFHEAAETGAPLTAVLAWMGAPLSLGHGVAVPSGSQLARRLAALAEQLDSWVDPWSAKFPDVTVTKRVLQEHPVRALAAASSGAQLTVVGCRGHEAVHDMLLGSVSHGVLHLATSPVAVVHDYS